MKSLVLRIEIGYQTLAKHRLGQTFCDDNWIVAERCKQFAQHVGLFGVLRHAIHLSLQLLGGNRPLPVILQRLRLAQIAFDFLSKLRLRHHRIERWLGIGPLLWPDAVTPVNVFYGALISHAFPEGKRSCGNLCWRFGTEESQQRSSQDGTCDRTNNNCDSSSHSSRFNKSKQTLQARKQIERPKTPTHFLNDLCATHTPKR
jgi:hypothetical protein